MKILVTSASFQNTPGPHMQLLSQQGYSLSFIKGPVPAAELEKIIGGYDALLCGDDDITAGVLQKGAAGRLKYISKYGVGVDRIDTAVAKRLHIPVTNCPGVNQVSVAELVFSLLLSFARHIPAETNITKAGGWQKMTGFELFGKTIGIVGFGAIGREVAKRAVAFGMPVLVATPHPPLLYLQQNGYAACANVGELATKADVITLHLPLTPATRGLVNDSLVSVCKPGTILINTARGGLVDANAVLTGLQNGVLGGYLADVLEEEPMPVNYPLNNHPNVLITPHIGSRTVESVARQGTLAVENLVNMIAGNVAAYRQNLV